MWHRYHGWLSAHSLHRVAWYSPFSPFMIDTWCYLLVSSVVPGNHHRHTYTPRYVTHLPSSNSFLALLPSLHRLRDSHTSFSPCITFFRRAALASTLLLRHLMPSRPHRRTIDRSCQPTPRSMPRDESSFSTPSSESYESCKHHWCSGQTAMRGTHNLTPGSTPRHRCRLLRLSRVEDTNR